MLARLHHVVHECLHCVLPAASAAPCLWFYDGSIRQASQGSHTHPGETHVPLVLGSLCFVVIRALCLVLVGFNPTTQSWWCLVLVWGRVVCKGILVGVALAE